MFSVMLYMLRTLRVKLAKVRILCRGMAPMEPMRFKGSIDVRRAFGL